MRLLVFDPFRGAAGDMVTATLLQLGADQNAVIGAMASVVGDPEIQEVDRAGIRSLALKTRAGHTRRTLEEVTARVKDACAPEDAIDMALRVFERISRHHSCQVIHPFNPTIFKTTLFVKKYLHGILFNNINELKQFIKNHLISDRIYFKTFFHRVLRM